MLSPPAEGCMLAAQDARGGCSDRIVGRAAKQSHHHDAPMGNSHSPRATTALVEGWSTSAAALGLVLFNMSLSVSRGATSLGSAKKKLRKGKLSPPVALKTELRCN